MIVKPISNIQTGTIVLIAGSFEPYVVLQREWAVCIEGEIPYICYLPRAFSTHYAGAKSEPINGIYEWKEWELDNETTTIQR